MPIGATFRVHRLHCLVRLSGHRALLEESDDKVLQGSVGDNMDRQDAMLLNVRPPAVGQTALYSKIVTPRRPAAATILPTCKSLAEPSA